MTARTLPSDQEMYEAILARDTRYDGIFVTAVTSTGIFCRPSCPAKKPHRRNVEFYRSPREALAHGFRPCKRCRPMESPGKAPAPIRALIAECEEHPLRRLSDQDLRDRGMSPRTVRRWFKKHHGMTFHAYQRARRLTKALGALGEGADLTQTAFENGYESLSGFHHAIRQITGRSASQSRTATVVRLSRATTPLGPMLLGTTDDGVCLLEFTDRPMLETQLRRLAERLDAVYVPGTDAVGQQLKTELGEYFEGTRQSFDVPLTMPGTPFRQRAWQALLDIPYGETRSYAEQAQMIGKPTAVRAVAQANGDNRIAIVIPCHRVIGADGTLTGYGGGLWRKRYLLDHEARHRGDGS